MERIEIRQSKKRLLPFLILVTGGFVYFTYFIFFTGKFDKNNSMKLLYIPVAASFVFSMYLPTKRFIKNVPILVFTNTQIELNEKGDLAPYLWQQVIDWKIDKDRDTDTYYLTIETKDKKRKINISWLDKKPRKIEELLKEYSRK
jgi:hypothetical protein